jgi:4a-hydroxytetrahydrobiopterin dehydratase
VALLDDDAIAAALAGLAWQREGSELVKVHRARGFLGALSYLNAVGYLAEQANHHPDAELRYDTVTLRLSTHSAGGITEADLDLARKIDQLG